MRQMGEIIREGKRAIALDIPIHWNVVMRLRSVACCESLLRGYNEPGEGSVEYGHQLGRLRRLLKIGPRRHLSSSIQLVSGTYLLFSTFPICHARKM